jgi:hypothetical protein
MNKSLEQLTAALCDAVRDGTATREHVTRAIELAFEGGAIEGRLEAAKRMLETIPRALKSHGVEP